MSIFRWIPVLFVVFLSGCVASTGDLPVPSEPVVLPDGPENPSAWDYYQYGESLLEERPGTAAEAFYWASRRDPTWATPIFARRLALFLDDDFLYSRYLQGSRSALKNPAVLQLDSLYLRALKLNPFLDRRLDGRAMRALWRQMMLSDLRQRYPTTSFSEMQISFAVEEYIEDDADPGFKAWIAHSEGRYDDAVELYTKAIAKEDDPAELHADMARALFMIGRYEEAVEHMETAIAELRDEDEDELQRIYSSKALYLHCVGLIAESREDTDGARDAYAEALQEDLSYAPAHVRLAELALAEGDTATALNEMRLAAEISPDEAAVLLSYGRLLESQDHLAEAATVYGHLTEVEPYFAAPFVRLATVLDRQGRLAEAAVAYRTFLATAPADADELEKADTRLEALAELLPEEGRAAASATDAPGGGG